MNLNRAQRWTLWILAGVALYLIAYLVLSNIPS